MSPRPAPLRRVSGEAPDACAARTRAPLSGLLGFWAERRRKLLVPAGTPKRAEEPLGPHVMVADPSIEATTSLLLHRDDHWRPLPVLAWEKHPTEDVAVLTVHDTDGLWT